MKKHILLQMEKHLLSARETASFFNIPAFTTILKWKNIIDIHGIKALAPKKKGRPTLTKKQKSYLKMTKINQLKNF